MKRKKSIWQEMPERRIRIKARARQGKIEERERKREK